MHHKRKNCNKENNKQSKRTPLANLPSLACTDDLLLSHNSTELKHFVKTLDLRKPSSGNPYKKAVSRKSNSKSVKQNPSCQPPKLKCLMKQFKQLKLLHENERSKSRSPVSCKSRSMEKQLPKKQSLGTLGRLNRDSEPNLCLKLQRTIKKLNQTNFFREDDSLIPLSRNSEISSLTKRQVLLTQSDEIVDLGEMREFCSTASLAFKKEAIAFKSFDLFQETMAATKIQRAWRKYQTKRLISRYAFLYKHQEHLHSHGMQHRGKEEEFAESAKSSVLSGQLIFRQEEGKESYTQQREASDKQQERSLDGSHCSQYQQIVQKMKVQELEKWNQIIRIISDCRTQSPQALQELLLRLAQQSELNKRQLQEKIRGFFAHDSRKKIVVPPLLKSAQIGHRRDQSLSSQSQGIQQYDSKKYIDYLDVDIFIEEKLNYPFVKNLPRAQNRISKQQQEILLNSLNRCSPLPRIGHYLQKSESSRLLELGNHQRTKSRESLRRSLSEAALKKVLSEMGEPNGKQDSQQINLQLLTRQFLEGSDPQYDNFDMVYSEERLRSKLAELNRLNHEPSLDYPEDSTLVEPQEQKDAFSGTQQGQCPFRTTKQQGAQIKIQEQQASPPKLSQAEISCSSDQQQFSKAQQKSETITAILMNNLVIELLKQIASSDVISSRFKAYSLSLRPKIRKVEGRKKKGFPTNKAEIELFLQGLLVFLQKEDPNVFASLQVPTGPSALEMLRYMHQCEEDPEEDEEQQEDQSNVMVIPNRIFDSYWGLKEKSIVIEVPNGYDQSNSIMLRHQFELLKSFNKIFYRSLFDTFNQCLDCQRNFGQYGKPFPWKKTPAFSHRKSQVQLKSSIERARRKMIQLSTTYCGLIVQQQEMQTISQEYVQQVHEDRLSRMLASDLVEAEQRWVFYDDEETEILVEVANAIYTQLLIELIEAVYDIQ